MMVREQIESRGVTDARVLAAMRNVPRHEFVPEESVEAAYEDHPTSHRLRTNHFPAVHRRVDDGVIAPHARGEGAGSRHGLRVPDMAVLAKEIAARRFYSIEIIEPLAKESADRLQHLGYS